jgi:hypothetical protein
VAAAKEAAAAPLDDVLAAQAAAAAEAQATAQAALDHARELQKATREVKAENSSKGASCGGPNDYRVLEAEVALQKAAEKWVAAAKEAAAAPLDDVLAAQAAAAAQATATAQAALNHARELQKATSEVKAEGCAKSQWSVIIGSARHSTGHTSARMHARVQHAPPRGRARTARTPAGRRRASRRGGLLYKSTRERALRFAFLGLTCRL